VEINTIRPRAILSFDRVSSFLRSGSWTCTLHTTLYLYHIYILQLVFCTGCAHWRYRFFSGLGERVSSYTPLGVCVFVFFLNIGTGILSRASSFLFLRLLARSLVEAGLRPVKVGWNGCQGSLIGNRMDIGVKLVCLWMGCSRVNCWLRDTYLLTYLLCICLCVESNCIEWLSSAVGICVLALFCGEFREVFICMDILLRPFS
jgi:uncharacterized membrane protein